MKKIIGVIVYFSFLFVPLFPASAQGLGSALGNLNEAVGSKSSTGLSGDLSATVGTVVKGALALVGTIFLLLTIYAGILWMTASGKEDQIETAKKIVTATIIGLFITLSAYAITAFVTGRLTGSGGGSAGTCEDLMKSDPNIGCYPPSKDYSTCESLSGGGNGSYIDGGAKCKIPTDLCCKKTQ